MACPPDKSTVAELVAAQSVFCVFLVPVVPCPARVVTMHQMAGRACSDACGLPFNEICDGKAYQQRMWVYPHCGPDQALFLKKVVTSHHCTGGNASPAAIHLWAPKQLRPQHSVHK